MKNLTPAELAVVAAVDRDRIADDLAALVRIPSITGDEAAVQTEAALRMATAGLEVTRVDADPASSPAIPISRAWRRRARCCRWWPAPSARAVAGG